MQEGGRGAYRFSEGTWRPATAPEARRRVRAMHEHIMQQSNVLPRVAGKHVARQDAQKGGEQGSSGTQHLPGAAPDTAKPSCIVPGGATGAQEEPCEQSVHMIDVDRGQQPLCMEERRPMTGSGSSIYATAMRQLESEQRQLVSSPSASAFC